LTDRSRRQVDRCSDEPTRVPGPRHAASERIATAVANRAIVATGNKAAARSNDVCKRGTRDADLEHAAVRKATLEVVILAESHLRRGGDDRDKWRIEPLVAHDGGVINERGVRQCISDWRGHSGI
jgi:hypothetical protein